MALRRGTGCPATCQIGELAYRTKTAQAPRSALAMWVRPHLNHSHTCYHQTVPCILFFVIWPVVAGALESDGEAILDFGTRLRKCPPHDMPQNVHIDDAPPVQ